MLKMSGRNRTKAQKHPHNEYVIEFHSFSYLSFYTNHHNSSTKESKKINYITIFKNRIDKIWNYGQNILSLQTQQT